MLVLRWEQIKALGNASKQNYLWRLEVHLREQFAECRDMAPDLLREFTAKGVARAESHGFQAEADICKFLNLCVVCGADFDRRFDWAARILATDAGPRLKMARLYGAAERAADAGELL